MTARVVLLAAALGLAATRPAVAHIVSDREVVMLKGLPEGLARSLSPRPDSLGYLAPNRRGGWRHVEHQESGIARLMDACARSDSVEAEACWLLIDAAMRHQTPAGDYEAAPPEARPAQLERTAWWIGQLCRAEVAVMNSPLQKRFRWRVALLLPKLRRSVDWLVAAGDELHRLHEGRPERLLVDAQAFLLADGIYHEPRMAELGQRALVAALGAQRKDGALVSSPRELWAHARALTGLTEVATYFPMPALEDAAKRASQWLIRGLEKQGKSAGLTPGAWREALLALALQAERTKDGRLRQRVERFDEERDDFVSSRP
jgi:hypothetical protein